MLSLLSDIVSADMAGEAAIVAVLGQIVTIIGIIVLIFVLWLVAKIVNMAANKKKKEVKEEEQNFVPVVNPKPAAIEKEIPDEVKAAIVAAIAAYYTAEKPMAEFKVKRIKRI